MSEAPGTRSVVLCDDHPLVLEAETSVLLSAGFEVLAAVGTARDAVAAVQRLRPRLLVLDMVLPDGLGSSIVREIRAEPHPPQVLLLTSFSSDAHLAAAFRSGADGILLKSIEPKRFLSSIETILRGETVIDRDVSRRLAQLAEPSAAESPLSLLHSLSPRELEVLRWVAHGERNSEIARLLGLSERTVKSHVSAILYKLDLLDRTQAAVFAWRAGLVS